MALGIDDEETQGHQTPPTKAVMIRDDAKGVKRFDRGRDAR